MYNKNSYSEVNRLIFIIVAMSVAVAMVVYLVTPPGV